MSPYQMTFLVSFSPARVFLACLLLVILNWIISFLILTHHCLAWFFTIRFFFLWCITQCFIKVIYLIQNRIWLFLAHLSFIKMIAFFGYYLISFCIQRCIDTDSFAKVHRSLDFQIQSDLIVCAIIISNRDSPAIMELCLGFQIFFLLAFPASFWAFVSLLGSLFVWL